MSRRRVIAVAAVAFGVSFAAKPISNQAIRNPEAQQERTPWAPGADMLMSAHESGAPGLGPPR